MDPVLSFTSPSGQRWQYPPKAPGPTLPKPDARTQRALEVAAFFSTQAALGLPVPGAGVAPQNLAKDRVTQAP